MAKPRISYVDPDTISDAKMKEELDRAGALVEQGEVEPGVAEAVQVGGVGGVGWRHLGDGVGRPGGDRAEAPRVGPRRPERLSAVATERRGG